MKLNNYQSMRWSVLKTLFDIQKVFTHEHTCYYELYYKYSNTYSRVTDTQFNTRHEALVYVNELLSEV